MEITEKDVQKMKELGKRKGVEEISDAKAREMAEAVDRFASLILDMATELTDLARRIRETPGGFPIDSQTTCKVCERFIDKTNGWESWYGHTCLICKKAIEDGIIPYFVCMTSESYYRLIISKPFSA